MKANPANHMVVFYERIPLPNKCTGRLFELREHGKSYCFGYIVEEISASSEEASSVGDESDSSAAITSFNLFLKRHIVVELGKKYSKFCLCELKLEKL